MQRRQTGVTLLEMILVIVLVGLVFTALAGLFSTAVRTLPVNERLQSAGQLAQACAERILSTRRTPEFNFSTPVGTLASTNCPMTGTGHTLTLSETTTPSGTALCPSGLSCRYLSVSVMADGGNGAPARLDFLLAQ